MALALFRQAQTAVQSAQLDLSYTKIFAPCDGRVTRKSVEPGDYVQVGQQLMSIVPADVWVVANFKESQLKKMQPGQPVLVEIDALAAGRCARTWTASRPAAARPFSLLPPENATGNYVKVVQRVPVKILFDEPLPADHVIGPGLSVAPSVRVSGFEIPGWAIGLVALVLAFVAVCFRFVLRRKMNAPLHNKNPEDKTSTGTGGQFPFMPAIFNMPTAHITRTGIRGTARGSSPWA